VRNAQVFKLRVASAEAEGDIRKKAKGWKTGLKKQKKKNETKSRRYLVGVQVVPDLDPPGGVLEPDEERVVAGQLGGLAGVLQEGRDGVGHHAGLQLLHQAGVDGGLPVLGGHDQDLGTGGGGVSRDKRVGGTA
jgi:hypothetical protein